MTEKKRNDYLLRDFGPASELRQQVMDHIDAIPRRQRPSLPEWLRAAMVEKMERDGITSWTKDHAADVAKVSQTGSL